MPGCVEMVSLLNKQTSMQVDKQHPQPLCAPHAPVGAPTCIFSSFSTSFGPLLPTPTVRHPPPITCQTPPTLVVDMASPASVQAFPRHHHCSCPHQPPRPPPPPGTPHPAFPRPLTATHLHLFQLLHDLIVALADTKQPLHCICCTRQLLAQTDHLRSTIWHGQSRERCTAQSVKGNWRWQTDAGLSVLSTCTALQCYLCVWLRTCHSRILPSKASTNSGNARGLRPPPSSPPSPAGCDKLTDLTLPRVAPTQPPHTHTAMHTGTLVDAPAL